MEEDKITIICPQCKKKTRIPNIGDLTRNVICSSCKYKASLMLFQVVNTSKPAVSNAHSSSYSNPTVIEPSYQPSPVAPSLDSSIGTTTIEQRGGRNTMSEPDGSTRIESPKREVAPSAGYLQIRSTNQKYMLKQGINIIGRQHATSQATIQIATNDGYMSRQHMKIEVFPVGNKIEHRISDNNSTNRVTLNGKLLNMGDIVILQSGDRITIGHTELLFMI